MKLTKSILSGAFFIYCFFTAGTVNTFGQERLSINESNIEGQFNYVMQRSDKIEDSRIVKSWYLYSLKAHVLDSMKAVQDKLLQSQQLVAAKQEMIDSLNGVLEQTNGKLSTAVKAKNNLNFLGIKMEKSSYKSIMWIMVGVLTFGLLVFVLLFKRSNIVTVQTRKTLEEVRQEYEAHRKRALAREEQIVRKLHDELNKYKNKVGQRQG